MGDVSTCTLGWVSAGYHVLEIRMRLQPISKEGCSLARSAGSATARRRWAVAIACDDAAHPAPVHHLGQHAVAGQRLAAAQGPLQQGDGAQQPPLGAGDVPVQPRQHPAGGALEDGHRGDPGLDGGHDLDGGGAGADDRDPLAGQVGVVVPARRVADRAAEPVQPVDAGLAGSDRLPEPSMIASADSSRVVVRICQHCRACCQLAPSTSSPNSVTSSMRRRRATCRE